MRVEPVFACLISLSLPPLALAQNSQCAGYSSRTQRICNAAIDGTRALHPMAGLLVSGGNPVLGTAGGLGGLGRFSVTARANAVDVVFPDVGYDGSASTVPSSDKVFAPAPLLEVAAGIYPGLPSGLLSVDVLGSAQLLPTDQIDHLAVDQGARRIGDVALGLGYGVRIGLIRENGPFPAVSVSVMRRDIPRLSYGDLSAGDQYRYGVDLHATNLRVVAGKQLASLALAVGLGWDRYTGDAVIQFRDPNTLLLQPEIPLDLKSSRVLAFLDAGLNLSAITLVGEVGYQGGKNQKLSTNFEDFDTAKGKFFAGLGLRVGF
jgi:hypothetical protein